MRPARLLLLVGSLGALLPVPVAGAAPVAAPAGGAEEQAVELLTAADRAARARTWEGTQLVATWRGSTSRSAVVRLRHRAGADTHVRAEADPGGRAQPRAGSRTATVPNATVDPRLLPLLAQRYALRVTGDGTCSGRSARVVEATRTDGRVAGRFWVDRGSGLLLRREVYDASGALRRSAALVDLRLGATSSGSGGGRGGPAESGPGPASSAQALIGPEPALPPEELERERREGRGVPQELPGGYVLYDAHRSGRGGGQMLHLGYSDGLSTLSVFRQPGRLDDPGPGWTRQEVDGQPVHVADGVPERVAWTGAGHVFTVLSDAGHDELMAVVRALPHDDAEDEGLWSRLGRGLSRLAQWLDPW